jgi:hypothetical protein
VSSSPRANICIQCHPPARTTDALASLLVRAADAIIAIDVDSRILALNAAAATVAISLLHPFTGSALLAELRRLAPPRTRRGD